MNECTKCDKPIDKHRYHLGYTECVGCSDEEKYSAHQVYPHKTGGYVQVVDSQTYQDLNRIDRRGYKGKGPRQYKNLMVKEKPMEERKSSNSGVSSIKHLSYDNAFSKVMGHYDEWGYDRTIKYLKELSSNGNIPLKFRVTLQGKVVDRCMKPTPRALIRKYSE